ncbi:efflux RND transporter periplasmic adaptor subunit [Sinobacterium norvegicum]|nr:efflux RND transporter periplasmic adaptor subunit [Sinobacterium norvegicum]
MFNIVVASIEALFYYLPPYGKQAVYCSRSDNSGYLMNNKYTALFLSLSLWLLGGCDSHEPAVENPAQQLLTVETVILQPQSWQANFDSYGYLESTEEVTISVDFSGTAREVNFKEGQAIKAGQVLIRLDDRKQQFRYNKALANVESAQSQVEQASATFRRHRDLVATGALSQEQFKDSETHFERSTAALQESRAALALSQQELRDTVIISPVDGLVADRNVEPGQTVLPGDQLAVAHVTDTLRMVTFITQREVNLLHIGEQAVMTTPGVAGREYQARIESIGSSADPATGNFTVKLTVNNSDHKLKSGMSAKVRLTGLRRENMILVPNEALVDRNRRRVVYRVENGTAIEVEPVLAIPGQVTTPVLAGINPGDQIIVSPLELIRHGKSIDAPIPAEKNTGEITVESFPDEAADSTEQSNTSTEG